MAGCQWQQQLLFVSADAYTASPTPQSVVCASSKLVDVLPLTADRQNCWHSCGTCQVPNVCSASFNHNPRSQRTGLYSQHPCMCVQHSAGLQSNTIPLPVSCVRHDNHANGFVSTAADTEAPAAAWSIVCCAVLMLLMYPHTNHLSITTTAYQTLLLRTMLFRHLPSAVAPAPTSFKTARCNRLPKRLCSCCWALHQSATAERCHSHNIWDCSLLPAPCCLLLLASKTHQSLMPSSNCCAAGMLPLPLLLTQCASQSITACHSASQQLPSARSALAPTTSGIAGSNQNPPSISRSCRRPIAALQGCCRCGSLRSRLLSFCPLLCHWARGCPTAAAAAADAAGV